MNEQQVKDIATQVFKDLSTQAQFNVTPVPIHLHNQIDSPKIPPTSVTGFVALPANNPNGVVSPVTLDTQKVNNFDTTKGINQQPLYAYPLNIIYGYGVGVHSAFNGGDASEGSVICFSNAGTTAQLFIKVQTGNSPDTFIWRGVTLPLTA